MKMKRINLIVLFAVVVVLGAFGNALASKTLDWNVLKTLQLDATPIDVDITPDGGRIFVLTDKGEIIIHSTRTNEESRIDVGKDVDHIKSGPGGETIVLTSEKNKTIQIVSVEFVQNINTAGAPFKGPENAPVAIVVFDDFQCPYCARLEPMLAQVIEKHPNDVKLVFKNFPLRNHPFAMKAAVAALAAESQGKFWEFHDLLFKNYNQLSDQKIKDIAVAVGLNQEEFEKKKEDPAIGQRINQDMMEGQQAEVRGTPTVFINGVLLRDRSLQGFDAAIDKQLQKLGKTTTKPAS
jgi:protein-disulfide isomerase